MWQLRLFLLGFIVNRLPSLAIFYQFNSYLSKPSKTGGKKSASTTSTCIRSGIFPSPKHTHTHTLILYKSTVNICAILLQTTAGDGRLPAMALYATNHSKLSKAYKNRNKISSPSLTLPQSSARSLSFLNLFPPPHFPNLSSNFRKPAFTISAASSSSSSSTPSSPSTTLAESQGFKVALSSPLLSSHLFLFFYLTAHFYLLLPCSLSNSFLW